MQTSIRVRLTAWYVAALALTLLLLSGATYFLTRAGLHHWLDEELGERAEALADDVRLVDGRPASQVDDHGHERYEGASDGFLILDSTRSPVVSQGLDGPAFVESGAVEAAFRGHAGSGMVQGARGSQWRTVARPLLSGGRVAAVVVVGHDLHEADEVLERLGTVMLALLPLGLIGAGLGGYALAGRALGAVDQITRKAAAITERDLSQRLPVETRDELGRLATTFNELIERLQHAFERQRRFTADASHELRTPLSIIQALTSQKLMRPRTQEEYEQTLRQIDESTAYMTRLVNHLLVLARADAGQVLLERERLELTELLEHVAGQVGEASGRSIPVEADGAVLVSGDPLRLTELFLNLLENAVKYTPPDGEVAVRVEQVRSEARVRVSDTGIGIPAEHLPHIFERFYRADKVRSREEGGTGLGLAISLWIAEAHGGTIRAESKPGRGTKMTVVLPTLEEQA